MVGTSSLGSWNSHWNDDAIAGLGSWWKCQSQDWKDAVNFAVKAPYPGFSWKVQMRFSRGRGGRGATFEGTLTKKLTNIWDDVPQWLGFFPTSLCGVLVFDSVSPAPSPPPPALLLPPPYTYNNNLTHTNFTHTNLTYNFTHTNLTYNIQSYQHTQHTPTHTTHTHTQHTHQHTHTHTTPHTHTHTPTYNIQSYQHTHTTHTHQHTHTHAHTHT